jgi:hypothetical protein
MRPVRLRIIALLAGLALLLPEATFARVHYFCRMMDRVIETACCCGHDGSTEIEGRAEVRQPDCCARVTPPSRSTAPNAPDTTIPVPGAALATMIDEPLSAPPPSRAAAFSPSLARGPPQVGPPLFLAHCSFLI